MIPYLEYQRTPKRFSVRWIAFVQLHDIALFNLLHVFPALEEVGAQTVGELAGHNEKLVVNCFRQRDEAAGGNETRSPMKHESGVRRDQGRRSDRR